jgi:hypothetical protein
MGGYLANPSTIDNNGGIELARFTAMSKMRRPLSEPTVHGWCIFVNVGLTLLLC